MIEEQSNVNFIKAVNLVKIALNSINFNVINANPSFLQTLNYVPSDKSNSLFKSINENKPDFSILMPTRAPKALSTNDLSYVSHSSAFFLVLVEMLVGLLCAPNCAPISLLCTRLSRASPPQALRLS